MWGFEIKELSLPYIWHNLNYHGKSWVYLPVGGSSSVHHRGRVDQDDRKMVELLAECPAPRWSALCEAAGPTVYGAVGLSWCRDAVFTDVLKIWLASGFILKPLPEYERPARFVNPAMLPEGNSLLDIVSWSGKSGYRLEEYDLAICMKIASLEGPLDFDMNFENAKKAPQQIAAFLKSRMMQQKPQHTAEEAELLKIWDAAIKGSPYDVWEGA